MRMNGKAVTLPRLKAELAAAGVVVPALGTDGDNLHTYGDLGEVLDLPPAATAVLVAHVADPPDVPIPVLNLGNDVPPDYPTQLTDAVTNLRTYLALASPTQVQSASALKLTIRLVLFMAGRLLR